MTQISVRNLGVVLLSTVIVFAIITLAMKNVCHRLSCMEFATSRVWQLKDVYEEKYGSVYRALYTDKQTGNFLRVDIRDGIDGATAYEYIRGKIAGMKALYDNIRSPYPGLLSNEITCDDIYKPSYTSFINSNGIQIYQIVGYLNDRMVFGSCLKDQIQFEETRYLFSCPGRHEFYDMEFISRPATYPKDQFSPIAQSLRCR